MFSKITAAAPSARNAVAVVGVTSDGKTVPAAHAKVPAVADALDTPGFAGDNGEVVMAGPKHVLLGLGASAAVPPATVRAAAARSPWTRRTPTSATACAAGSSSAAR